MLSCQCHSRRLNGRCFTASSGDISTLWHGRAWTGARPDSHTELCLDKASLTQSVQFMFSALSVQCLVDLVLSDV